MHKSPKEPIGWIAVQHATQREAWALDHAQCAAICHVLLCVAAIAMIWFDCLFVRLFISFVHAVISFTLFIFKFSLPVVKNRLVSNSFLFFSENKIQNRALKNTNHSIGAAVAAAAPENNGENYDFDNGFNRSLFLFVLFAVVSLLPFAFCLNDIMCMQVPFPLPFFFRVQSLISFARCDVNFYVSFVFFYSAVQS